MMKNLLITGAGVDRTEGISFPLAATLLPEIAAYLEGDGKEVDTALRELIQVNLERLFPSTTDFRVAPRHLVAHK